MYIFPWKIPFWSTLLSSISTSLCWAFYFEKINAYSEIFWYGPSFGKHLTPSKTIMAMTCWWLNLILNLDPLRTKSITPVTCSSYAKNGKIFLHLAASIFLPFPPLRSLKFGILALWLLCIPFFYFFAFYSAVLRSSKYFVISSSTLICWMVTNPFSSM